MTTTTQDLIPPPRIVRERLGYHLREIRMLRKLLRVSEAAADERRDDDRPRPTDAPPGRPAG